jgi:UDP-N-acetylglucosamine 2-epimerase (non-hydrolysing)
MKIICVVGTRPNFMKIAPILEAMKPYPNFNPILVHTGQHYDYQMSGVFFKELEIPEPDVYLGVGSASHSVQTAKIMIEFEQTVLEHQPDLVLVVGDVNSTMAAALVAAKLHVPIAHVEAGIRSFDREMPEEINRIVTDAIADYLFPPSNFGRENLLKEGVSAEQIFVVGDTMIDTLFKFRPRAEQTPILAELGLAPSTYALMTLHRPANVDIKEHLSAILDAIEQIQGRLPIVFPIHPRTKSRLESFGFNDRVASMSNLRIIEPVGYCAFLNLMIHAHFVLTDSGGMQEETTVLGVPCLTLRDTTERPETVEEGTNTLVGDDTDLIVAESLKILDGKGKTGTYPEIWDGRAAERIVEVLNRAF